MNGRAREAPSPCGGHYRACTHRTGFAACPECVRQRGVEGPLLCADLDNCGGPGCMDNAPVLRPGVAPADPPAQT